MSNVTVLGSTGSIGTQCLEVVRGGKGKWTVFGLAAGSNATRLMEQVREFRPRVVAVPDERVLMDDAAELSRIGVEIWTGSQAIQDLAALQEAGLVVSAIAGIAGVPATYSAVAAGKTVALANKESLVTAGNLVMNALKRTGARILPVDSEHSAICQCLQGKQQTPARIWLTASGGPFRGWTRQQLETVTPAEALRHPTWRMGRHITIDSATMLNKGLEVIEAHWLFSLPYEDIRVVVHPESLMHSIVEFSDGSCLAQLGTPDMRQAIQFALCDLEHVPPFYPAKPLSPPEWGSMHFEEVDEQVFRGLSLALEAGRIGGTAPAAMNAAKEVAVEAFLHERIDFLQIERIIEKVLEQHNPAVPQSLNEVLAADRWARRRALEMVGEVDRPC